jgi:hypothetical protein
MKIRHLLLAAPLLALTTLPAQAALVTITFDGLATGVTNPLGTYSEGGFSMLGNDILGSDIIPGVAPAILTTSTESLGATGDLNLVEVDTATPFQFVSLDWNSANSRETSLSVTGFLGMSIVGTDVYTTTSLTSITSAASILAGKNVDHLTILFTNPSTGTGSPQLDTLRLDNAPVPEPASALLFGLGGLGLLAARRRRRTA